MSAMKWFMKQYWRIGAIRALSSLTLGMFVLGRLYYSYIPPLAELGLLGALILGTILVLIFMGIGWYYDAKAKMWSPKMQARVERDPFRYVPNYKSFSIDYPVFYSLTAGLKKVFETLDLDTQALDNLAEYLETFYDGLPRKKDIISAEDNSLGFMQKHPFVIHETEKEHVGIRARIKGVFEVNLLRIVWIQSLTGLVQDTLVFGALYSVLIFEGIVSDPYTILLLGIVFMSLPLLIVLTTLGWFYDKKLKVWSVDAAVKVERNPFSYVAEPKLHGMTLPFVHVFVKTLRAVFIAAEVSTKDLDNIIEFLNTYQNLDVSNEEDMKRARNLRQSIGTLFDNTTRRN